MAQNMENKSAEDAVIGALIIDSSTLPQIIPILGITRDKFATNAGIVYEAIVALDTHNIAVDPITVNDYLSKKQSHNRNQTLLDVLGENWIEPYLGDIISSNITDYAKGVQDSYTSRRIVEIASDAISQAFGHQDNPEQALAVLEQAVTDIRLDRPADIATGRDMAMLVQRHLAIKIDNPDYIPGFSSSIINLDKMINFEPSRLITLAGRPGLGKTQLATFIAFQLLKQGKPIYFISMEMSRTQMMYRLVSLATGINSKTIRDHPSKLLPEQLERVQQELGMFLDHKYPFYFTFGGKNILEFRAHARQVKSRCKRETGKDLATIVVDYAQLIPPTPLTASSQRELQVGEVSRTLKLMSLEDDLDCPILMVSQLNRNPEGRADKRPMLADLRASGSLEQDSDIVIFTYPTLQYASETERKKVQKNFQEGWEPYDLIIAKNRDGEVGTAKCAWRRDCGHIRSLEKQNG